MISLIDMNCRVFRDALKKLQLANLIHLFLILTVQNYIIIYVIYINYDIYIGIYTYWDVKNLKLNQIKFKKLFLSL